jgi:hypothetical protein
MGKGPVSSGAASVKRWTLDKQAEFLGHLAASCNVKASAQAVGMSEQGVHRLRLRSPEFRTAWEAAIEEGYVRLELFLLERAIKGASGAGQDFSERLALALLQAARPATRRSPRAVEVQRDRAAMRAAVEAKLSEMNRKLGGEG